MPGGRGEPQIIQTGKLKRENEAIGSTYPVYFDFPGILERETRLELATPTLARLCSTTELFPRETTRNYKALTDSVKVTAVKVTAVWVTAVKVTDPLSQATMAAHAAGSTPLTTG